MAELIPGGVAAFFTFGYLGYLWTYSYTWPLGVILTVYVLSVSFALQRFTVFDVYIELPTAAELGVALAWLIANASLLPPLVPRLAYLVRWTVVTRDDELDSDIEGGARVETYSLQASTIVGTVLIVGGAFTLGGVFGDNLTFVEQLIYGIPEVVVGVGLLIYGFYGLLTSARRTERADARYILYIYLFAALPPLAYGLFLLIISPFEIVPLWITLFSLTALVVVFEIATLGVRPEQHVVALEGDPRYARAERYPIRIIQRWVLVTMLPPLVIYTVCWVVESLFDDVSTGDSLGGAAAATAVMALITIFFGGLSSPTRANGYFVAEAQYDDERGGGCTPPPPTATTIGESRRSSTEQSKPAPTTLRGGRGKRRIGVDLS